LDSSSGEEMMKLLQELHSDGHTIILVTHDADIARFADRVIEIKDGEIIGDKKNRIAEEAGQQLTEHKCSEQKKQKTKRGVNWSRYFEALKMALIAMSNHRLRTFLTMLGIIIGIASVVTAIDSG
jgi:macrolide transport system ATP-binding/permease protein